MATMNPKDFFTTRLADMELEEQSSPIRDRFNNLIQATERRTEQLRQQGELRKAIVAKNAASAVGRLGLDEDGIAAQAVNAGASVASGVGRVTGQLLSAPASLAAGAETSKLTNSEWAAFTALQDGTATPEQVQQLNRDTSGGDFTLGNVGRSLSGEADTPLARIQAANAMRQGARGINDAFDWGGIVHQDRRDQLSQDLGENFQANWDRTTDGTVKGALTGVAGLLAEAGRAAVNNPGAVAEYVAENIPQLALGAFGAAGRAGLAASNVGYAADNFQKGIEKYQAENKGAYPPPEVREEMALWAAATAGAEQVGDVALLRGIGRGATEAAETGRRSLRDVAKALGQGTTTEAATEGFQTYAEGQAGLKPATPQEIYEGAVIGGLVGGAMQGGGSAVVAAGGAISTAAERADTAIADRKVNNAAFDKAVEANDPSTFTKPNTSSYAPDEAVRVLAKAATEENREANYQQAAGIVADAETRLQDVQDRIAVAENPDNAIAEFNNEIAQAEAVLATAAPDQVADIQQHIADQKQNITDVQEDVAALKTLKQKEAKLNKQVTAATKLANQMASRTASEEVAEATTPEQANKVINLAMTAPGKLDTKVVRDLIADTGNALTNEQRSYLRSVDAARLAENVAKDVSLVNQDVLFGSAKFKGIRDYRERLNRALVDGKTPIANAVVSGFSKFATQHQSKATAIQQAYEMAQDGGTFTVAPNKAGVWNVLDEQLSESARKQVGGLNIHANSTKLVDAATYEAEAVNAALTEFRDAIAARPTSVATATPLASSQQAAPSQATQMAPAAVPEVLAPTGTEGAVTSEAQPLNDVQSTTDVEMVRNEGVDQTQVTPSSSTTQTIVTPTTNSPAETSTNTVEETEREKSVFDNKVSEEEAKKVGYKKLNLVAQYFKASKKKVTDATDRPLVSNKDFLSKLAKGNVAVTDYLVQKELTEEQTIAISDFIARATAWLPEIQSNLYTGNPDFRFEDPIQFLVTDTDGVVDAAENVKTAIAYGAYSWFAENANMPRFATREQVKEMFGVDEQDKIGNDLYSAVRSAGVMEKVAMNSLGQRAVAALGLKATKGAPADSQARLEASIGAHAMILLENLGLVERTKVPASIVAAGLPTTLAKNTNVFAELGFIAPTRNVEGKLIQAGEEISKAQKATQSVLNKLFGVETEYKEPSFTPITQVQQTTKNTDQKVPTKLQEIMKHENSVPNLVRQDTWFLSEKLSEKAMLEIAGYDSRDTTQMHKVNRESVEAKNDGLMRELQNARDYFPTLEEDQELFFEHSVWKQQRVGIATNLINPQTSKIHRFMLFRPEWETKVSLNDVPMMENFYIRVAEGMGVKADKQSNEVSLMDFAKKITETTTTDAVNAIQQVMIQGAEMTPAFEQAILTGVKTGGEDMHSLDALIALAHYKQALDTNQTSFTTHLMGEVDGVTNGPMLSHLMMGAGTSVEDLYSILNKGGFYTQESGEQNYNLWRASEGNQDLYETTIANVMKTVQATSKARPAMQGALASLYAITGDLLDKNDKVVKAGRNIIKTPLTAMVFGSSTTGAINSMFEKFLDTAYEKMEDLMKVTDPAQAESKKVQLIKHINNLITYGEGKTLLSEKLTIAQLLDTQFSAEQEKALNKAFKGTLGNAVKTTMETDFSVFMERRTTYNIAAEAAFQLFNAARTGITETLMTELMDAGEMEFTTIKGVRTPLHDLTGLQQEELAKRLKPIQPILQTLMSLDSGDELDAGLAISKSSRKLSEARQYRGVAKFGKPTKAGTKSLVTAAYERTLTPPGVAMLPMGAHSTDSAISHYGVMGFGNATQVLNVHDAHGTGLGHFQRTAQNLNHATWDAMLRYSPATEMVQSLNRVILGVDALLQDSSTAAVVGPYINTALEALAKKNKTTKDVVLQDIQQSMVFAAAEADTIKFQTLAQMGAVDQYALEGGQYEVTNADREAANEMLKHVSNAVDTDSLLAANRISDIQTTKTKPLEVDEEFQQEETPTPAASLAQSVSPVMAAVAAQVIPEAVVLTQGNPVEQAVAAQTPVVQAKVVQAVSKAANTLRKAFSPWGEIGNPTAGQDQSLVEAFEAIPDMNKTQVMTALRAALQTQGGPSNVRDFNARLFTVLNKLVPADILVKYVTPNTPAEAIMEMGATNARGWFVSKNGSNEIYILSTAHKNAAVTPEVLLHELTHSVLAGIVENVASQPQEVKDLVNELEKLRAKAQEFIKANNLTQYDAAVANVHEYIAYGMTNLGFQKDVVSKTSIAPKNTNNVLVKGMKAFIDSIVGILFRGSDRSRQAITVNGMTVLISNVSGLFNAVSQVPSKADVLLKNKSVDPLDSAMELGTVQIMEAIKSSNPDNQVSGAFLDQMNVVLSTIVDTLHGPFGTLKELVKQDRAITPVDVYVKALNTGALPFASKSIAAGFKINDQEAFVMDQVEATVRDTIGRNETQTTIAHRELRKVYAQAKSQLKPMDFLPEGVVESTASQGDKDAANALYNYVFTAEMNADGTSDYLSRFAAMTLGHEQFASKMGFITEVTTRPGESIFDKVLAVFDKLASWIGGLLTNTREGQVADEKVMALVGKLVDIEAKRQAQLAQKKASLADSIEGVTKGMSDSVREQVIKFGKSKTFGTAKNGYIRLAGTAIQLVGAPDRVNAIAERAQEMRDKLLRERQGITASLITEMQGISDDKAVFGKLLLMTKNLERARKEAITNTANFIIQSFAKREFTKQENKAVTNTFLRTDMASLVDSYTMTEMEKLVSDTTYRKGEMAKLEAEIAKDTNGVFYMNSIKGLGYYMATGKVRIPHLQMNAHNIARAGSTSAMGKITEVHALSIEPKIDQLVSLYALDYLGQSERSLAANVLRGELNRADGGNGVEMIIKLHKNLQQESKDRLFEGNDALFMKGYTSEIYNPYLDVMVADDKEGRELMLAGYSVGVPVPKDPLDRTGEKKMYVMRDGGLQSHLTGILSYTGKSARGSTVRPEDQLAQASLVQEKAVEIQSMFQRNFDPKNVGQNYMAPVINNQGMVADYRYMMNQSTKDDVLERDNRFDKILGTYAGSILDKQTTPVQNKAAVQALFDQYQSEADTQADRYLEISAQSNDPVLREHWNLLPKETKEAVKAIWGESKMYVRTDMIDLNFGYRKYSLANIFKKDADERGAMEKLFVHGVGAIMRGIGASRGLRGAALDDYLKRASLYTRRAEDVWQEIVKEAKDIIVVRSGVVLLGNISSNLTELAWMGVPFNDIVRHHKVALKAASDYQADSARLHQVQTMLSSGYIEGNVRDLEQEVVTLTDALNRNPVKELIDAGLMPTIVEDLATDDDIYSYKSRFARKTEGLTNKLNDKVKAAAKIAYVSHDTALYKGLNRATQLSDFVARYTLYHHVTERANNPLSKEDAVRYASDAFVNYDIPSHRSLQYMNDMGVVMFTKYYIRIQKVLMRLFRENPARAMMMLAFNHYFNTVPTITDSALWNKFGNLPFTTGAFKYPSVLDDLAPVKIGMSPFN